MMTIGLYLVDLPVIPSDEPIGDFHDGEPTGLLGDIYRNGQTNPIGVRATTDVNAPYTLVYGKRRLRAMRALHDKGLTWPGGGTVEEPVIQAEVWTADDAPRVSHVKLAQVESANALIVAHTFPWCRARLLHALGAADEQGVLEDVLDELLAGMSEHGAEHVYAAIARLRDHKWSKGPAAAKGKP